MEVKGQNFDIDKLINDLDMENNFREHRGNDICLSNNQISILKRNNIDYKKYSNLSSLIFAIEEYLDAEEELDQELDNLLEDLSEFNYYKNTNK